MDTDLFVEQTNFGWGVFIADMPTAEDEWLATFKFKEDAEQWASEYKVNIDA